MKSWQKKKNAPLPNWLLTQGEDIVPIPGTKHTKYVEQNARAVDVDLTKDELARIGEIAPQDVAAGSRYTEQKMQSIDWQ